MKSKDIIAKLQELDPSGEIEVFVDNMDIFTIHKDFSCWDGCPTLLLRDESKKPYYDIIGWNKTGNIPEGMKINFRILNEYDILLNNPDAIEQYHSNPVNYYESFRHAVRDKDWETCDRIMADE